MGCSYDGPRRGVEALQGGNTTIMFPNEGEKQPLQVKLPILSGVLGMRFTAWEGGPRTNGIYHLWIPEGDMCSPSIAEYYDKAVIIERYGGAVLAIEISTK